MITANLKERDPRTWQDTLLESYRFPPFYWIRGVDGPSRHAMLCKDLQSAFEDETAQLIGAFDGSDRLVGFVQVGRRDWDTNHFGFDVWGQKHMGLWGEAADQMRAGQQLAHAAVDVARAAGVATVHARLPVDNIAAIHALEDAGFKMMEVQVLWLYDLHKQTIPEQRTPFVIRDYRPDDADEIIELARRAYTWTPDRFHTDPNLPQDKADSLYAAWIYNSCIGKEADYMCVVEADGQRVGYGTLRYWGDQDGRCNVRIGQLLLGAVAPDYREYGINGDIMAFLMRWLKDSGADVAFVGTQVNNVSSQVGMVKFGYRPVFGGVGLHAWLRD